MQKKGSTEPPDDTLWVETEQQIRAGLNPRRQDIVDRLAASGPLSVKTLAAMVGARPSALYHHLRLLIEAGLVLEAGHRIVNRKREVLYDTPARRVRIRRALDDPARQPVIKEFVGALSRQMERDFAAGVDSALKATEGGVRNLGFRRVLGNPDAKTLARINAKLEEIGELLGHSEPGGTSVVALTWVMAPVSPGDAEDG